MLPYQRKENYSICRFFFWKTKNSICSHEIVLFSPFSMTAPQMAVQYWSALLLVAAMFSMERSVRGRRQSFWRPEL